MKSKIEIASMIMEHLVDCNKHGYSQINRYGDGFSCVIQIEGNNYTIKAGDRDCSSAVIDAYRSAGIYCSDASYTGNMYPELLDSGNFISIPFDQNNIQRGDILLNHENHTAMYFGDGTVGEFCISENGTIDGIPGDQTGLESKRTLLYDFPWDTVLRCINYEKVEGLKMSELYDDVPENSWAYESIKYCKDNGIMTGYDNKTFGYGQNVTREELATVIHRMTERLK